MRKFSYLLALTMALPVQAQRLMEAAREQQRREAAKAAEEGKPSAAEIVNKDGKGIVANDKSCDEPEQSSIPLSFLKSLMVSDFDITQDPMTGKVKVKIPKMVSNCNDMIQWNFNKGMINGKQAYWFEAKIKKKDEYKVDIVEKGILQSGVTTRSYEPNVKGFEQCLEDTGALQEGKAFMQQVSFDNKGLNWDASGDLMFLARGKGTETFGMTGDFIKDGCDYYEPMVKGYQLTSQADRNAMALAADLQKAQTCNSYEQVIGLMNNWENDQDQFVKIRNDLIEQAVKKSAENIAAGKPDEKDLQVVSDYEKYIINPKLQDAINAFESEDGERLKAIKQDLKNYNKSPYYTQESVNKLMLAGKFDDAERIHDIGLNLDAYSKLGEKIANVYYNPDIADVKVFEAKAAFAKHVGQERQKYEVKTGQTTGLSNYYASLTQARMNDVRTRTSNFSNEIFSEYARMNPGGYCYANPYRNVPRCIADAQSRISELQYFMQAYNQLDMNRAKEYEAMAKEFSQYEAEGRRYIAAQNGEEPVPAPQQPQMNNTLVPPQGQMQQDNSVYNFQWNQPQGQQQYSLQQQQPQYNSNNQFGYNQQPNAFANQAYSMPQYTNQYSAMFQGGIGGQYAPQQQYQYQPQQQYQPNNGMGYWGQPQAGLSYNYNMYR